MGSGDRKKKTKRAIIMPLYVWDDVKNAVCYIQKYVFPGYRMGHFFEDACLNHRKYLQYKYRQGRAFPAMPKDGLRVGRTHKEHELKEEDRDAKRKTDQTEGTR